jgi:hypothetical protein
VDPGIINLDRAEIKRGLMENDLVALNAADNRQLQDGLAVQTARPESSDPGLLDSLRRRILGTLRN